ncbi:MAG: hypothetical protein COA63_013910 [Methylophaga sp.]|nr:hypothetical protein [Methylophaga sp.]
MKKIYQLIIICTFALSGSIALADIPKYNVCSGAEDGTYADLGKEILKRYKTIKGENVFDLGGSMANFEASANGECAIVIAQPDAFSILRSTRKSEASNYIRLGQAHKEFVHLICSTESGVENVTDIEGDENAFLDLISEESGGAVTWANLVLEDAGYKTTSVVYGDDLYTAASNVSSGDSKCFLSVSGLGSDAMHDIDRDFDNLTMVKFNDKDANDAVDTKGKALYEFVEPTHVYKVQLQNYFWDRETVSMQAAIYLNKEYLSKDKAGKIARKEITKSIVRAAKEIKQRYK